MIEGPFKVVLDANVLYPFTLRDVLLESASKGFYQVYWSEEILDEALRNLVADKRMTDHQAATLAATMRRAFPEAQVSEYETLVPAMRNDPKDRHVVAAAVRAGAQIIVTSNVRHFYDLPPGIEAQKPDDFLCDLLDLSPARMLRVLRSITARWRNPPVDVLRLLDALGQRHFAEMARAALRDEAGNA